MSDLVNIYNTSDVDQHATTSDGKRHSLVAQEIRAVPEDVASAFLYQRGRYVQLYKTSSIPPLAGETSVFIANVTGNPFLPKKVSMTRRNRATGLEEIIDVDNPRCNARPLTFIMQRSQSVIDSPVGSHKESISLPGVSIKIPPYVRIAVGKSVADWLSRRDAQMDELNRGSLIECRGPSDFEPNDSWPVEEIYLYAELMDARVNWKKNFPVKGLEDREGKLILLNALFFRLTDDRYTLVDRNVFREAMDERTKPAGVSRKSDSRASV